MKNCIFCKIAQGEIEADIIERGNGFIAISDIAPKAKIHILVFPQKHIADSIDDKGSDKTMTPIVRFMRKIVESKGIDKTGYRIVTNHGMEAGQSVNHIHFHLLGGEKLKDL